MATITGFTAARMLEIEDGTIVDAEVVGGELILTRHDGTTVNAGPVTGPAGPVGPAGPAGGLIPGEIRLWPNSELPELASYGLWTWANGAVFAVADHPIAASHIAPQWRTFGGASDPGAANFRVPDMRGLVPAGMDQMPGDAARANRMTRSVAITIAAKTGEETHIITLAESVPHNHSEGLPSVTNQSTYDNPSGLTTHAAPNHVHLIGAASATGAAGGHETVQPTVMIPYIVKLDD
jgi:microcystin-dependent protein